MNAIAKGCLQSLIAWGLGAVGLYFYFKDQFEAPLDMYGAIGGGFLISCAYGTIVNAKLAMNQRRLIHASRKGAPMQDGQPIAAVGTIHALREPLRTPFRQRECISYSYGIHSERRTRSASDNASQTTREMLLGGFAMTPCAVRTPISNIRILGFAMPMEFPEDQFLASEYHEQIEKHLATTQFGSTGFQPGKMFSQLKNALTDDDGELQEHWRTNSLEDRMMSYPDETFCKEQLIPNGAPVCVIGSWSAAKGGVIGNIAQGGLQIFPGDAKSTLSRLSGKVTGNLIFGLVLLAIGTAGVWGILTAYANSSQMQARRLAQLSQDVERDAVEDAASVLKRGVDLNSNQEQLEQLTAKIKSVEMAKLLRDNGLDLGARRIGGRTAVENALYLGDAARVRLLIESGADVNRGTTEFGNTTLEVAFDSGDKTLYELVRQAGGRGIIVTRENGKPIDPSGEQVKVIQAYLNAHVAQDSAALRSLVDNWPDSFFDSFERGIYNGTRIAEFAVTRGYYNDEAATILVRFPGASSGPEDWVYTLVKHEGIWKIRRESWDRNQSLKTFF